MIILNPKKLKTFTKIVGMPDIPSERLPNNVSKEDWATLKRILSAKNIAEISDISDEEIVRLSAFCDDVVIFFNHKGEFFDGVSITSKFSSITPLRTKKRRVL